MNSYEQDNIYFDIEPSKPDNTVEEQSSTMNELDKLNEPDINEIRNNDAFNFYNREQEQSILEDDKIILEKTIYYNKYTVKELLLICEYYNIHREIMYNKLRKEHIIEQIIWYEIQMDNIELVNKRFQRWNYMNIIKKDPVLGKFLHSWKNK
jgi:hypothetical protein